MRKRIISALLAVVVLLGISSCGKPSTPASSSGSSEETVSTPAVAHPNIGITEGFQGVFFNPNILHATSAGGYNPPDFRSYTFLSEYRQEIQATVKELVDNGFNLISIFLMNLHTMKNSIGEGNKADQSLEEWANLDCLNNFAQFIDDCYALGMNVEVDLIDNRWVPYSAFKSQSIGKPGGWWPVADDTPWEEAATWYTQVIEYIENKVTHPEAIAMWSMQGNYELGGSEPILWDHAGAVSKEWTEKFVKYVWPKFVKAGKRPKGSPYMLPILPADDSGVELKLSSFHNLYQWLVTDLKAAPDYWLITSYSYSDPAPHDNRYYLKEMKNILTKDNNGKILLTDLKMLGHEYEIQNTVVLPWPEGVNLGDMIKWNQDKIKEYDFAGYWIWGYQDNSTGTENAGVRNADGTWKEGVLEAVK